MHPSLHSYCCHQIIDSKFDLHKRKKKREHTNIFVKMVTILIDNIIWKFSRTVQITPSNPEKNHTKTEWLVSCKIRKNFKFSLVISENILEELENTTDTPLFHSNRFISDFKHKAEGFDDFFSYQCSLINNNSKPPTNLNYVTDRCLSSLTFSAGDIAKIIQNLQSLWTQQYQYRMFKICGDIISKPLELSFRKALTTGTYLSDWKKSNNAPVYKKGNK